MGIVGQHVGIGVDQNAQDAEQNAENLPHIPPFAKVISVFGPIAQSVRAEDS